MRFHPLPPSVKCQHCGRAHLEFVRTRSGRDLYRCTGTPPCKAYTVHFRGAGRECGYGTETSLGATATWIKCEQPEAVS
jgi:ssDNA-binding Zn-finger/Zn-ribbon topoisomerase 1